MPSSGRQLPADDIILGAFHDRKQFLALRLGYIEFRHRVVEILAEGRPLTLGDLEMFVRFTHRATSIFCGPPVAQQTVSVT